MTVAYFAEDGRLICTASGEMELPEGAAFARKVEDGAHANDIHYDLASDAVVSRQMVTLAASRALIAYDVADSLPISGLSGVGKLVINGSEVAVTADFYLTASAGGVMSVEATGAHRSNALVITAVTRAEIEAHLHNQVDAQAGEVRKLFITEVPGQEMTYLRKEAEARKYLDDQHPSAANYPLLTAEAAATNQEVANLAQTVIANADAWAIAGAQIEALRVSAKDAISRAESVAEMFDAAAVDWASIGQHQ